MDAATRRMCAYERHRSRALEYERKFVQHARRAELHRIAFGAPPPPPPPSKMQGRVDTLERERTDGTEKGKKGTVRPDQANRRALRRLSTIRQTSARAHVEAKPGRHGKRVDAFV